MDLQEAEVSRTAVRQKEIADFFFSERLRFQQTLFVAKWPRNRVWNFYNNFMIQRGWRVSESRRPCLRAPLKPLIHPGHFMVPRGLRMFRNYAEINVSLSLRRTMTRIPNSFKKICLLSFFLRLKSFSFSFIIENDIFWPDCKFTFAVRETGVSRHNGGLIKGPPQYDSAVMVRGVSGGAHNWIALHVWSLLVFQSGIIFVVFLSITFFYLTFFSITCLSMFIKPHKKLYHVNIYYNFLSMFTFT